jgi:hypothetical protein
MSTFVVQEPAFTSLNVIVTLFGRASDGTGRRLVSRPQDPSNVEDSDEAAAKREISKVMLAA